MSRPALRLTNISKTFSGTKALDEVSFEVESGSIHALLGGNGSGKSTLIKILAGVYEADPEGTIEVDGSEIEARGMTPATARKLGLRFVHQNPGLFAGMSVSDNLALGSGYITVATRIAAGRQRRKSITTLESLGLSIRPEVMIGELRPAEQTMVAIARSLQDIEKGSKSVLVLDEPTASLPAHEVEVFFDAVRRLAADGQTIIFVSHRIDEVLALADTITVLRDGKHVITRPRAGLDEDQLVAHIVGRKLDRVFPPQAATPADGAAPVLVVEHLAGGPLRDVSFSVQPGEVVGIAGLLGSGRTELLRMIFGDLAVESGTIRVGGESATGQNISGMMRRGVGFVPEDRAADAALPDMSVRDNLTIATLTKYWRRLRVDTRQESLDADTAIHDYLVKTADQRALLSSLSGGNQQKVILARWMRRNPRLLLLDEPTQGVDVGARADLYRLIRDRVAEGLGAIVVSSDFDELARACDRVLILSGGQITATVSAPGIDNGRLTELVYLGAAA